LGAEATPPRIVLLISGEVTVKLREEAGIVEIARDLKTLPLITLIELIDADRKRGHAGCKSEL
jgi:hypothetical protein